MMRFSCIESLPDSSPPDLITHIYDVRSPFNLTTLIYNKGTTLKYNNGTTLIYKMSPIYKSG